MNTNTAQTRDTRPRSVARLFFARTALTGAAKARLIALGLLLTVAAAAPAQTVLQPWVPIFKGIDYAAGTNTPGGGSFPNLQVVYFLRVDLTDPDIRLFASPRNPTNYTSNYIETAGYTATNFLKKHNLQAVINANSFFLPGSLSSAPYFRPEGSAFHVTGLLISEGELVSQQEGPEDAATLKFTSNNVATFVSTNWPASSTNAIYTAVTGLYSILVNGVNIGSNYIGNSATAHRVQPRTLFGLSQDRRYLYLLAIDGRQEASDYSIGAYDWEAAEWLRLAGASDAVNMDGGGSTCMVVMDSTGQAVPLNHDSASLNGPEYRERTVGCHFGVYAAPLPGFFNDVKALPSDTTATITWTTVEPATTQLRYGLTTNLTLSSESNSTLVVNHAVILTNLSPNTGYYFNALASTGTGEYVSSNYFFITANYVTTNVLFDFTNAWKFTITNLDGVNWTALNYDDSAWESPGAGMLWVDVNGTTAEFPVPLNTQMPENPNTAYPYTTYYFRTRFTFTNDPTTTLLLQDYLDDGAVFYLNGTEISRVRMPPVPAVISNATFATGPACSGDATCPDNFALSGPLIATNLLVGDNVLAVEAHNYNAGSSDVMFCLSAAYTVPYVASPQLTVAATNNAIVLNWSGGGFTLQEANAPTGPWTDVPGPVILGPFIADDSGAARFYRLRK
jgi:hypothetical protein